MHRYLASHISVAALVATSLGCGVFTDDSAAGSCDTGETVAVTLNARNAGDGRGSSVGVTDGKSGARVVTGASIAGSPSFSPDGKKLVIVQFDDTDESATSRLAIVDTRTGGQRVLEGISGTRGEGPGWPDWSPNGRTIAYARTTGITSDATSEIRVVDAASGESDMPIHVVTGNSVELSSPTWSPDGRRIAFLRRDASIGVAPDTFPPLPRTGIWIADADGSNARQVAVATDAQHIDWKPDGSSLLISGSGPAGGRASVLRLSDGTLSEVGANARLATWSADGKSVYSYAEAGGRWRLAKGRITDRSLQRTGYVPGIENTFIYDSFGIATPPCTS